MDILYDDKGIPLLHQPSEDSADFVDLTFGIVRLVESGSHYRFRLASSYWDQRVGLDVELVKGIQAGFDSQMNLVKDHVYRTGVRFIRSGPESDRLIATVAELYGFVGSVTTMVSEESFTAIALHQGELDFDREAVKLKLFGRDGEGFAVDDYYESFFNVDFSSRLVFWNEKDPDYRAPLLRALAGMSG